MAAAKQLCAPFWPPGRHRLFLSVGDGGVGNSHIEMTVTSGNREEIVLSLEFPRRQPRERGSKINEQREKVHAIC